MKKILVLEDEPSIRSFVVINLRRSGYEPIEAATGEEALEKLKQNPDTLVALLDVMLPDIDGFEVCRRIRATGSKMGILMLSAKSQEMDKVQGLMLGADDYITKPFSLKILLARIEAVFRRGAPEEPAARPVVDGLLVDPVGREVKVDGQPVELTYTEFELLTYLMTNSGVALSRDKILDSVWRYDYYGDARTVDTHVKKLRSKLGRHGDCIKTIRGIGYKFEPDAG